MSHIVGTIYAQLGDGWQAIGTTEGGVNLGLPGDVELPCEVRMMIGLGSLEAADAVLALLWKPGDPLYDRWSSDQITVAAVRPMISVHDDGDRSRPMTWPRGTHDVIERYGATRRAEPGPWSWLQPGRVRR